MRLLQAAFGALILAVPAWAQAPQMDQRPPLQQQWHQEGSSPVQQAPVSPLPGGQQPDSQVPPLQVPASPSAPTTMERPNVWIPAAAAKVQALDKVTAQSASLTIKVGGSATFGSLTITAKACMKRPTDQPPDAAAYLAVTDSRPDSPGFTGWMLENEPSVSMMEHPIYDLRVTGCA
jgi:hypothetical protein